MLTALPDDFAVSPAIEAMCKAEGLPNPHDVIVGFRDKAIAKNYRYADWEAAFRGWMRSPITAENYPAWVPVSAPPEWEPPAGEEPVANPHQQIDAMLERLMHAMPVDAMDQRRRPTGAI